MKPITKKAAIAWLSKTLGPRFRYQENPNALLAADRPTRDEIEEAEQAKNSASHAMGERSKAVLAADPEYQELLASFKAQSKALAEVKQRNYGRRITVGRTTAFAFMIDAEGDDWQEVVNTVKREQEKA